MSLCQSEKNSCGACCGILNLNLEKDDIFKILGERSREFSTTVDFKKNWTIAEFRKKRESNEESIPRINKEIYVCPFLGYITTTNIGCMIHPNITGDPLSQNFSFYGASICQGYNCKNKESENIDIFQSFILNFIELDNYIYMNIFGDHILLDYIKSFFESKGFKDYHFLNTHKELVIELILRKFNTQKYLNTTSFEFGMESGDIFSKLVDYLDIKKTEELYFKLVEI